MLVEVLDRNVVEYKNELAYAFDLGKVLKVENYPYPAWTFLKTTILGVISTIYDGY